MVFRDPELSSLRIYRITIHSTVLSYSHIVVVLMILSELLVDDELMMMIRHPLRN